LFSEIDPIQNLAVAKAVTLTGFSEGTVWSGSARRLRQPRHRELR